MAAASSPPAEVMVAVAVTEPDFGSDVAGVKVTATPATARRRAGCVINGVKTWCTFGARADVLMLLARTDPDRSKAHRGLSPVHRAQAARRGPRVRVHAGRRAAAKMEGRADRHDRLPRHALLRGRASTTGWCRPRTSIGGDDGLGRGFYYQMEGFENGRLQTAARAVGVMQAAYEAARDYASDRDGVRPADRRLPAHPGRSSAAWRCSSRPAASSPTTSPA